MAPSLAKRQFLAAILLIDDVECNYRDYYDVALTHVYSAHFSREAIMASVVLAVLVVQTRGVKFYDFGSSGVSRGERCVVLRRPDNLYDVNCLDVRLLNNRLLGHVEALVAAHLSLLSCAIGL